MSATPASLAPQPAFEAPTSSGLDAKSRGGRR